MDPPPHQEMAEGRRTRGWRVVGNEKGDSARLADFHRCSATSTFIMSSTFWVQHWRTPRAMGEVIVIRYADDMVLGFQYRAEAERFLQDWQERLQKFGLDLHPDKTRLIEFGGFAANNRKQRGERKPETFNFLGSLISVDNPGSPASCSCSAKPFESVFSLS